MGLLLAPLVLPAVPFLQAGCSLRRGRGMAPCGSGIHIQVCPSAAHCFIPSESDRCTIMSGQEHCCLLSTIVNIMMTHLQIQLCGTCLPLRHPSFPLVICQFALHLRPHSLRLMIGLTGHPFPLLVSPSIFLHPLCFTPMYAPCMEVE